MPTSQSKTPAPKAASAARRFPLGMVLAGVFTVLLIVTVFLTLDSGEPARADEYGTPAVTGSLPKLADSAADPAVGTPAPEVVGAGFDGATVSITDDGRAKILLLVAHWCPYCQAEVAWVSPYLRDNPLPDGVDLYGIATAIDRTRENWPPSEWLAREGFAAPVVVDDRGNSVANAFGLPAYPYWVFVRADGTVAGRVSGGITPEDLAAVVTELAP